MEARKACNQGQVKSAIKLYESVPLPPATFLRQQAGCRPASTTRRVSFATARKGTSVNWREREPTLEDILSDPIIKELMKADGVDPHQLSAMLKEAGRRWAGAHVRVRCACRHCELPE